MDRLPLVCWEGEQDAAHSLARINRAMTAQLYASGRVALVSGTSDVHVAHQWPPVWKRPETGHWVVYQAWEYGSLPVSWVRPMNDLVDEIWVYSSYLRDCYIRSGINPDKIYVVPCGVDTSLFNLDATALTLPGMRGTNFLFVGGTIPRKGADILLETYLDTFGPKDDVCLIVKDFGTETWYRGQTIGARIRQAANDPTGPRIIYLTEEFAEDEMPMLYAACSALVQSYRGEGYGLPIAEAMACGLPVIVPDHGACLDYCDPEFAIMLPATEKELPECRIGDLYTVAPPYWCEVDRGALAAAMRHIVADPDHGQALGRRAASAIAARHTWAHAAAIAVDRLTAQSNAPVRMRRRTSTVCLAMIVKDESSVIERCLGSVRDHIAHWCIADTGSTDDTAERIVKALQGIPGSLEHDDWSGDFAKNRNLVLDRALASGCDYILSLDADELLVVDDPNWRRGLCEPAYMVLHRDPHIEWGALRLVKAALKWRWHDPFHEYLDADPEVPVALLEGARLSTPQDGKRSQDDAKLQRDCATMRRATAADPENSRLVFYLGMAEMNAGHDEEAIIAFQQRAGMSGANDAEVYHSLYRIAHLRVRRGENHAVPTAFLDAYAAAPFYAEPVYWLGRFFLAAGKYAPALAFLELAASKPKPPPVLFTEPVIYEYEARLYVALACMCLGRQADADAIIAGMERDGVLPAGALEAAEDELIPVLQQLEQVG